MLPQSLPDEDSDSAGYCAKPANRPRHSWRRDRALASVNCSAISAGLVESELFGHLRGAFTGAIESEAISWQPSSMQREWWMVRRVRRES
jgi:hypothetical protein